MRRTPSPRELVAILGACVEFEQDDDQEFNELLVAYSSELAQAIHTTPAKLLTLTTVDGPSRRARFAELLRVAKEYDQALRASAEQNLSLAAATMLATSAHWEGERVTIDARIVLGRNLRADRTRKFIRLDAEGYEPVVIGRGKLSEAGKALHFSDLTCSIERAGLRFRWRGGKGSLLLVTQDVDKRQRDAVLSVVMQCPRPQSVASRATPRQRTSHWLGDVFNELNVF